MLTRIDEVAPGCPPVTVAPAAGTGGGGVMQAPAPTQPGWNLNPVPTNKAEGSGIDGRLGDATGGMMLLALVLGLVVVSELL